MRKYLAILFALLCSPVFGATVIQTAKNTCSATTCAASFGSLPTAGHQVIVTVTGRIYNQGSLTVADNQSGNTYQRVSGYSTHYGSQNTLAEIWYLPSVVGTTGTFTVTVTTPVSTNSTITIIEATGAGTVDSTGMNSDNGTSATSYTVTNTSADAGSTDLVVSTIQCTASPVVSGPGSGWTLLYSGVGNYGAAYAIDSSGGTDSITWTLSGAVQGTMVLASFGASTPTSPHIVQALSTLTGFTGVSTLTTALYSVNSGNTLIANTTAETGTAPTVSDGTSYTQDLTSANATAVESDIFSLWNVSAGTHSVVATYGGTPISQLTVLEVAGLPTTNSKDQTAVANGNSVGPLTATTAALTQANEFALATVGAPTGSSTLATPTNFAMLNNISPPLTGDAIQMTTATTALSPSFGSITSSAWAVAVITYKAASSGATCTHNFWQNTGAFAIPNGSSGNYWSVTGAFTTPNCSTGTYWLSTGATGSN